VTSVAGAMGVGATCVGMTGAGLNSGTGRSIGVGVDRSAFSTLGMKTDEVPAAKGAAPAGVCGVSGPTTIGSWTFDVLCAVGCTGDVGVAGEETAGGSPPANVVATATWVCISSATCVARAFGVGVPMGLDVAVGVGVDAKANPFAMANPKSAMPSKTKIATTTLMVMMVAVRFSRGADCGVRKRDMSVRRQRR